MDERDYIAMNKELKTNSMKSAVDFLVETLAENGILHSSDIEQAKEMQKQHIVDARQSGINAAINGKSISNIDYYDETFK
jgi:hypothetical protein